MKILFLAALLAVLSGCGPKEIGQGEAEIPPASHGPDPAETMRMPITGANNTERMLYYYNSPDVMQNVQRWRQNQYRKAMGLQTDPEDPAYRAVPKQRSPFRQ